MNQDQKDIKAAINTLAAVADDIRAARRRSKDKFERASAEATLLVDSIIQETGLKPGSPEFQAVLDGALLTRVRRAQLQRQKVSGDEPGWGENPDEKLDF